MYQSRRRIALFTALCLFCSMIELVIPKPAFIKIGVSNIPIMLALYEGFSFGEFSVLVAMRILSQAMLNGTIASYSFILSLTAGISSALVMWLLSRFKRLGFVSISIAGAFVSNCCQICMSSLFLGKGVFSLAPLIIGVGIITSATIGLFCEKYIKKSKFLANFKDITYFATLGTESFVPRSPDKKGQRIARLVFASVLIILCFFSPHVALTAFTSITLMVCCIATGRKVRVLPIIWLITRTVLINVLLPSGRVLFYVGTFGITYDSLLLGIRRSLILLGSNWFSNFIIPKQDEMTKAFKPGSLLFMTFAYFKTITENWYTADHGNSVIERADNTLACSMILQSDC